MSSTFICRDSDVKLYSNTCLKAQYVLLMAKCFFLQTKIYSSHYFEVKGSHIKTEVYNEETCTHTRPRVQVLSLDIS